MARLNEILLSNCEAISSATSVASKPTFFTSTIFKFTSFPINFFTSFLNSSAPAPPLPIKIPGLAVLTFTFTNSNESFKETGNGSNNSMDTASKIQLAMLPKISDELAQRPEFDIFARMVPAKQVGGDLYDFFLIDNNHLAIVLGDVSGKGITAALFMVLSKNTIQNQLMLYGDDLEKAAYEINRLLIRDNEMKLFVTVWLGVLELDTGVLKFVNAGHELAAISRHMGEFELPKDKHSAIFGMVEDLKYKLNETTLEDGDTLYLFTDGIVEAMKEENNMFGKERMLNALNENPGDSVEKLDETVRTRVTEFVEDAEQFDDITSLCIRYHKK